MSEAIITPSAPEAESEPVAMSKYLGAYLYDRFGARWSFDYMQWTVERWQEYRATLNKEPGVSLTLEERAGFDEWLKERVK